MKNKKLKYVLIPLVIIVWGLIFYKVFSYSNDDAPILTQTFNPVVLENEVLEKDSFALSLKYADPFLKKNKVIKTSNASTGVKTTDNLNANNIRNNRTRNNKRQVQPTLKPTEIAYGGEIINNNSKHITAVIKVAGKNKLLSDGDLTGNVEILKIYSDSVQLIDQGQQRTIFKK